MRRSFFRRKTAKNPPGSPDDGSKSRRKSKKQFGRVGSLQHVRPAYEVNEYGQVEYNEKERRGASHEFARDMGADNEDNGRDVAPGYTRHDMYDGRDGEDTNIVDEIPPYSPKLARKFDSNLADDGLGNTTDDREDAYGGNIDVNANGNGYSNINMDGDADTNNNNNNNNNRKHKDVRDKDGDAQPKLGRTRSSKSKRDNLRKKSSGRRNRDKEGSKDRDKSRDRDRDRDRGEKDTSKEQRHAHHGHHGRRNSNLEEEASLLIELNKLLDTLTSRELQLSLRVDKASDSVRDALKGGNGNGDGDAGSVRKRAICALKHKKALEKSLAITTAQSDRVLKLLGHNVLTPLADRIEAAAASATARTEEHRVSAAALAPADNECCDGESDEQIQREIDATIAAANNVCNVSNVYSVPLTSSKKLAPPDKSNDWLAEVREQHARRTASLNDDQVPAVVYPYPLQQRTEKGGIDDFETVPESVSLGSPRPSREKRSSSNSGEPSSIGKDLRPSKSSSSFSRRRRKSRK